jgi:uncharacterized protein (DUF488 family)
MPPSICTIGHSNRSIDDFLALLRQNGIACVLDIRTVPKSRHNPQFGQDQLPASLAVAGIDYRYLPGLGGLRKARPDSANTGWRNLSFRGYADYMQSAAFAASVDTVTALADTTACALMCAEAVPWRCHRSLVADALLVRGVAVDDIIDARQRRPHTLTPFAVVDGLTISYPAEQGSLWDGAGSSGE